MTSLFAGATVTLLGPTGEDSSDGLPYGDRVAFYGRGEHAGWALRGKGGETLDSGLLARPRHLRAGDRLVLSVKSAIIGDLLGITAVFMPSGFVVATPTVAAGGDSLGGGLSDGAYAYPEQEVVAGTPWWLPKRRWVDPLPGGWVPDWQQLAALSGWRKRLAIPETWCRETVRRRQQELVAAGVI